MEEYNCRTCLASTDRKRCTEITKKCYLEKTIKEVIIYLVPEMEPTLSDDELICKSCLRTLKLVMKFIEGCLEVEAMKAETKDYFEGTADDFSDDEDDSMENVAIKNEEEDLEYMEETTDDSYYPVDSEVDQRTTISSDSMNKVKLDHDYLNKPKIACKVENENAAFRVTKIDNGSNLVQYESVAGEIVYTNESNLDSSMQDGQEAADEDQKFDRPIEIVYDDSLTQEDISQDATENVEYVEYQCEESLEAEEIKVLACSTCSEVFATNEEYQMHLEIHPPFKCQYCDKSLMTDIAYKSHILWHKEKGFMCEFCGRCFKSSGALNMHINCTHEDENIYTCDQCDKQYKHKFKLDSHIKNVHLKIGSGARQQCPECGKLFQNKEACDNHYKLIHLQIKPFMCEICGLEFGRKDYLLKHIQRHNTEIKPIKNKDVALKSSRIRLKNPGQPVVCKVCGKQIKTVHLLKAHLQTHVRIKRHKCKFCELTFTLSTNRDRHEKLHESDPDNKFRCNICWKRVKTEEDLERHIAGHSNRPPQHSCDICGERFHRRYLVDNHLLDKHTGPGDIEKAEEEIVFKNLLEYVDPKLLE